MTEVYVTTMYRWGDRESHSYLVGIFPTDKAALFAARREEDNRGGKYLAMVEAVELGHDGSNYAEPLKRRVIKGLPDQRPIILRNVQSKERIAELTHLAHEYRAVLQRPSPRFTTFSRKFLHLIEGLQ
ncbi:hypothetical protein ACEUAY_00510 [Aeromonas veronii]|jgi:hypothetical protein|uniref:hypothetical protein n=1 Tax=Aeromonas TaxID=642 RepID=UPI0011184CB2|nr:hypothetical protein [Aeromonas veronii]NJI25777.1 hypothetical protein [Aeromonas veronii]TNI15134.1 hypothetical protein CF106_02110 [Aeromonas veronii]